MFELPDQRHVLQGGQRSEGLKSANSRVARLSARSQLRATCGRD
jgi:hypothetical protein